MKKQYTTRRRFQKAAVAGAAAAFAWPARSLSAGYTSKVSLTKGTDRADNAFRAMQVFKREISEAIGGKRIIVKPNVVTPDNLLADTHVDWVEGILEFLKSIGRTDVYIAESTAGGGTVAGYEFLGYNRLADRYPVKFIDLNQEGFDSLPIWETDSGEWDANLSRVFRNPDNYIISCPRIKTHSSVVATLSLKNVAMAAPKVDLNFFYGQPNVYPEKWKMHSGYPSGDTRRYQVLNDNIFRLAKVYGIKPDLAVIDGYEGMQGEGPVNGYEAPLQYLGICSPDWVAADRVCVRLMGHDGYTLNALGPYPACLNYCGQAGLGEWDYSKIEVVGEPVDENIVSYEATGETQNGNLLLCRTTPKE